MPEHHKPDKTWTLEFEDDEIWATLEGEIGPRVVGGSDSPTFRFYSKSYLNKDPPLPKDHGQRYETLLEHCKYAGNYVVNDETDTGEVLFREQHTGPSLLVKVEPEYDAPGARGVWALIAGYSDETRLPTEMCIVSLDLDILAWSDDYSSHDDTRSNLEMRGP